MFTFLNPWFWLGALAVAAPLWLHLRRKEPRNLVRFSALRFLEDQPQARASPRTVENWPLLLLRLLALLLLIAGLAWPFRADVLPPVVEESVVYVLDNTLSHQASGRFAAARERLAEELGVTPPYSQRAVIELTSRPQVIVAFTDEARTALDRLAAVTPSHQRGAYLAAFRAAGELLAGSLGGRKRLVFIGDHQANQWHEHSAAPPFLRGVKVEFATPPAVTNAPTFSLSEPVAQRVFLGDRSLVNFSVQLHHPLGATNAEIEVIANGKPVSGGRVELNPETGLLALQGQWAADANEWLRGEARVTGAPDELPADDRVFFALEPLREGTVAVIAASEFVRAALSPEVMRGQWAARFIDPARFDAELAGEPDADALVLESRYLQSAAVRRLLWRYLSNGRGALLLINEQNAAVRGMLRELGFEPGSPATVTTEQKVAYVHLRHPVFHPFGSPDFGNLAEITFRRHARLKSSHALPLMFTGSGDGVLFQGAQTAGKLFVATFGLDRQHTSWPVHPSFVPFLDLVLQSARQVDAAPTRFAPGEIFVAQFPNGSGVRAAVLRAGEREVIRAPVKDGRAQIPMPDAPGLYELAYDDELEPRKLLAVNPPAVESELEFTADPAAVRNWQLPAGSPDETRSDRPAKLTLASIWRQSYWWWLLLAGLLMLAGESLWTRT